MRCLDHLRGTLFAAGVLSMSAAHADPAQITWVVMDFPPAYILQHGAAPASAAELGSGVVDREMADIASRMPQYEHKFALFNVQRIWKEMEAGHNLCFGAAYKTPEHEALAYMIPAMPVTGIGLVVREDAAGRMRNQSSVSLAKVLDQNPDLNIFLESARSYGPAADSVLAKDRKSIHRVTASAPGELLHLVDAGRVDFTLEFLSMVEYRQRTNAFQHTLIVIPLEEVPELTTTYVACTRNAWGKKTIDDIAVAVRDAARGPHLRAAIIDWLPAALAKTEKPKIDRYFDDLGDQLASMPRGH